MKIKIKRVGSGIPGPLPTRASDGAACYDVVATRIEVIEPRKIKVYLGFATEIPKGYKGCIVPRSSFTHQNWIMQNSPAQIDEDYRGEWMLKFQAIPDNYMESGDEGAMIPGDFRYPNYPYKVGDRVAQIYFEKVQKAEFTISLDDLDETERGSEGFGSTGNTMIK
jgi:dUTP pyrophosphatase